MDRNLDLDLFFIFIGGDDATEMIQINSETLHPTEGLTLRTEVSSIKKINEVESIDVMLDGSRNGVGRHYATIARVILQDGEGQVENTYCTTETKMETGETYNFFKCG